LRASARLRARGRRPPGATATPDTRKLYLDLLRLSLTDLLYETDPQARAMRQDGGDWPGRGHTMIGIKRLDNIIIDDYGSTPPAAKAVADYRAEHGIDEPIVQIDWTGVYWQKR
jgi:hypothetical protein